MNLAQWASMGTGGKEIRDPRSPTNHPNRRTPTTSAIAYFDGVYGYSASLRASGDVVEIVTNSVRPGRYIYVGSYDQRWQLCRGGRSQGQTMCWAYGTDEHIGRKFAADLRATYCATQEEYDAGLAAMRARGEKIAARIAAEA